MIANRASRWLAWSLWGVTMALSLTGLALLAFTLKVSVGDIYGARGAGALISVPFATVGALLASRRPRNAIGWLFSAAGLAIGFGVFGEQYPTFSVARADSSLPFTELIAWLQNPMWLPLVLFGLIYPLLLFPEGRPPTPRWRWLLWVAPVTVFGFAVVISLDPGPMQSVPVENPYGIDQGTIDLLIPFVGMPFLATAFLSVVAMAQRFRRSTGDEHEQLKWFLSAGALTAFALFLNIVVGVAGDSDGAAWQVVALFTLASIAMIPIAAGIAILKYRLYDIEVVISRALAYSIVAGFLTAAYLGVIVGIGALVGRWGGSSVVLPIAATALAAAGFQPVRQGARAFANRLVYGKRTSAYETLTALASGQTLEELSPKVARLVTESTSARRSVVWLSNGVRLEPAASWPQGTPMPPPVQIPENGAPTFPGGLHTFSLIHQGDLLGAITAQTGPGERLSGEDNRLLSDLAAHAAIAFRGLIEAVMLPEGIVTFLMTDVEGSTLLWEEDPEATAAAMREHDALVRRVVQEQGGIPMKWRGEGDSTFSVFTAAAGAIAAAQRLQVSMAEHPWPTPRPLKVRAALHTAEAELRGRDYFGQAVNRCARLRAVASGGQALVSAATRELVRDRLPKHVALIDLGDRELKDLGAERVYELRSADLSVESRA